MVKFKARDSFWQPKTSDIPNIPNITNITKDNNFGSQKHIISPIFQTSPMPLTVPISPISPKLPKKKNCSWKYVTPIFGISQHYIATKSAHIKPYLGKHWIELWCSLVLSTQNLTAKANPILNPNLNPYQASQELGWSLMNSGTNCGKAAG